MNATALGRLEARLAARRKRDRPAPAPPNASFTHTYRPPATGKTLPSSAVSSPVRDQEEDDHDDEPGERLGP